MKDNLADLESLAIKCLNRHPKNLILEAITCYQNASYRASIVTTWVALVFDLLEKIQELNNLGNVNAQALIQEHEKILKKIEQGDPEATKIASQFESKILSNCREKLQFFDSHQFADLNRLREDRHRCAHPTLQKITGEPYYPSPEQVRMHIRNVIIYVLIEPPLQGKEALDELKNITLSKTFARSIEDAKIRLSSSPFQNSRDSLIKSYVVTLMNDYVDENSPFFGLENVIYALNAALQLDHSRVKTVLFSYTNKLVQSTKDQNLYLVINLITKIEDMMSSLGDASKIKINNYIIECGAEEYLLKNFEKLSEADFFRANILNCIEGFSLKTIEEAIKNHGLRFGLKDKIIKIISKVAYFQDANEVMLHGVLPLMNEWTKEEIFKIIGLQEETNGQLLHAYEYQTFIHEAIKLKKISEDEVRKHMSEDEANVLLKGL